ncbi:MAG TPA: BNR-4 repeat-containing protein [Bacilli bacterium]|nr:BNR-4 repeat-containing protein [Bacilli bacterium]
MYPASCGGSHVSGRTLHKILFYNVGGQVSGEGPCGIYSNIIPHEAEYVASQGKVFGFYQGTNLRPYAFTYDPVTGATTGPVSIGGSGLTGDSHGAPTFCIDASGYIHVFWGCHTSTIYYRTSTNPYDITTWNTQQSISGQFTYPSIFYYDGYWYLFHRTQGSYPLGWGWNRTANFTTWSGLTEVIKSSSSSDAYYATMGQAPNGNIAMMWCIWDGSIYKNLYYAYTSDMATWRKADGTAYGTLPINNTTAECVYTSDPNNLRTQTGDIQFDSNNRPHLLFNNNLNWTHAHFDGTEWTVTAITTKSTINLHVSACLIVDSDTNLRAYLQFSPPGDSAATWSTTEEYRSTDTGATWAFYQTLQGMTYRGLLNHIKNGTDGYRILAASSETDPHDIWIY